MTFDASEYAISDLHLFADVTDSAAAALIKKCMVMHIDKGQPISRLQDSEACMYVVLHGVLGNTVISAADNAGSSRTDRIFPGESVGELCILDEAAPSGALIALEDSELLVIDAATLWRLIDEVNGVARNLLRQLSFRLRTANAQVRRHEKVGNFYRELSMADGLTGLHNRAWLNDRLSAMVEDAHTAGHPLSLIMIDLDHFKAFNDTHGHPAGDNALRLAAGVLNAALRPSDFAVRYGGEEMVVILPDSNEAAGLMVAQRLCERLRQATVFPDMRLPLPHMTASFGVATLTPNQHADDLLARADIALYRAKKAGRNQVMF